MEVKAVYEFYQTFVKPIYSEIEARDNTIPVELLFETYAAFDHLKRYYLGTDSEDEATKRALSHLKRGVLDAFKLKLKYFNKDAGKLLSIKAIELIDNGSFVANLYKDKRHIVELAKKARLTEGAQSKEAAFEYWFEVSIKIDEFETQRDLNIPNLNWAKHKTFQWLTKDTAIAFIVGISTSSLVGFFAL